MPTVLSVICSMLGMLAMGPQQLIEGSYKAANNVLKLPQVKLLSDRHIKSDKSKPQREAITKEVEGFAGEVWVEDFVSDESPHANIQEQLLPHLIKDIREKTKAQGTIVNIDTDKKSRALLHWLNFVDYYAAIGARWYQKVGVEEWNWTINDLEIELNESLDLSSLPESPIKTVLAEQAELLKKEWHIAQQCIEQIKKESEHLSSIDKLCLIVMECYIRLLKKKGVSNLTSCEDAFKKACKESNTDGWPKAWQELCHQCAKIDYSLLGVPPQLHKPYLPKELASMEDQLVKVFRPLLEMRCLQRLSSVAADKVIVIAGKNHIDRLIKLLQKLEYTVKKEAEGSALDPSALHW